MRRFLEFISQFKAGILVTGLFCLATQSVASNRFWAVNTTTGSLVEGGPYRYYLEEQIRFADDRYKFNEFFFMPGAGYVINNRDTLFAGLGYIYTKERDGRVLREYRVWQQLSRHVTSWLDSRTRLEERRFYGNSTIGLRFRQRFWARIPLTPRKLFYLSAFDELFFHLNHPDWASPRTFSQNRAFIGLNRSLTQSIMVDAGYLNQLILDRVNRKNNVFLVSFTMRF